MNRYLFRIEVFDDKLVDVYVFDLRVGDNYIQPKMLFEGIQRLDAIFGKNHVRMFVYNFDNGGYTCLSSGVDYTIPDFMLCNDAVQIIETGFLPGVTDGAGAVVKRLACEVVPGLQNCDFTVHSSRMFTSDDMLLPSNFNKLVQYAKFITLSIEKSKIVSASVRYVCPFFSEQDNFNSLFHIPIMSHEGQVSSETNFFDLSVSDEDLESIGAIVGLSLISMKTIKSYLESDKTRQGCAISDIELEAIGQSWSEHCCHKIFSSPIDENGSIFSKYIKGATKRINSPECVSVFSDNAGAIVFDEDFLIVEKVETHNSPSALDPFGGAMTGILGVNRDILGFGLGAKPVMNSYYFCFAEAEEEKLYRKVFGKHEPVLSPKFIHDGVISGVNVGGNCSGIPTMNGGMYFNSGFRGKPLVFVGCSGLIPRSVAGRPSHVKSIRDGDFIVIIGGSTGLDGIHGATFSSTVLGDNISSSVVQIGDPFTQKKLVDAIIREVRDLGLYNSITDNGAGGLSSSVGEMGYQGFVVDLENVPLKVQGQDLSPWQIWVSESQERMTLSIPEENYTTFKELMDKHEVQVSHIGRFNLSGRAIVRYNGNVVMDLDTSFLHNGRPIEQLYTSAPLPKKIFTRNKAETLAIKEEILSMLARPNICSMEYVVTQYDHEVQGSSILKPIQGVGRVCSETISFRPVLSSDRCVVRSSALGSAYGEIDTYHMAGCAIDHAIRNCIAAGANIKKLAMLDNFCWSDSTSESRLWELERAAKACYDYAVAFGVPFVSGKDSMFNDFVGYKEDSGESIVISAPPSLLISTFGVVDNFRSCKSIDAKCDGDIIYMLGLTANELCCSEYQRMSSVTNDRIPRVNAGKNMNLYTAYFNALNYISSAIPVNLGGIVVALAKKLIAGNLGAKISLNSIPVEDAFMSANEILFSETPGRIIVTIPSAKSDKFEQCFSGSDIAIARIGIVTSDPVLKIDNTVEIFVEEMSCVYKNRSEFIVDSYRI